MAKRPTVDKEFVIKQHSKDFILFGGLSDLGHRRGWCGCETVVSEKLSIPEKDRYVVCAVGRFRNEETGAEESFTGWGDADPSNSQMKGAYLRHAETRAIARMLRMATNVGMTAWEEMGPDAEATTAGTGQASPSFREQGGTRRQSERVRPAESRGDQAEEPTAPASAAPGEVAPLNLCETCGVALTRSEVDCCLQAGSLPYCTTHAPGQPKRTERRDGAMECSAADCGKPLTRGQHDVSLRSYGQPLCPPHQKQFTRIG